MARTSRLAGVGKRKIELSNLEKVLFPGAGILKAELIEYYVEIAPTILAHLYGRPLSFVRYPDGISGDRFFQKNRPGWAPEWIRHVALGDEDKIDYILASEAASLAWVANLACLELHQMHARKPHYDRPDYVVFDLDPPEDFPFKEVAALAVAFKAHVERFGYHAFVKTTGRKGLHILCPIRPKWGFAQVAEAAFDLARPFVDAHGASTTLRLKKEARGGKVLVDVYRNRPYQTIVSAYSVRGVEAAPIAMPVQWEELSEIDDPKGLNIRTVRERVRTRGDAWEGFSAYASDLHTRPRQRKDATSAVGPSPTFKSPESLEAYRQKRTFSQTPEPVPGAIGGDRNAFVIHRHHASRLHYDLRVEHEGALRSWAVPRGLPPRPGIKRLAISVEDHPIEYLAFDGTIPKGQYGGGRMWIFGRGTYEITKQKRDSFYFRLSGAGVTGEYRLIHTRNKEYLLERVDPPQVDWLVEPIDPMLSETLREPPGAPGYLYEVKWDGIRAMIAVDEGEVRIRSRSRRDITRLFPELLIPEQAFRASSALFDAEIVCLEAEGRPAFHRAVRRLHPTTESAIARARARHAAVCYLFDCLYLDGRPIVGEPLTVRREWMADAVRRNEIYRVSEAVEEGDALFQAARKMGLEGIMAKRADSRYLPGKRSSSWLKIKARQTTECRIIGYTKGRGDRQSGFGALHLARGSGDGLRYVGKVGTGFDEKMLIAVLKELKKVPAGKRPVKERPIDDARTTWLEPELLCEVQYASLTPNGTLREPVFVRLRPDLMS